MIRVGLCIGRKITSNVSLLYFRVKFTILYHGLFYLFYFQPSVQPSCLPTTATAHYILLYLCFVFFLCSVPKLQKWFGHPLYVLKMDCEGCEYVLADDVLNHNPHFFDYIYQFNIEIHTPNAIMTQDEHTYGLGRLYRILKLSGMLLQDYDEGFCANWQLRRGFQPSLLKTKFPTHPGCQSFLFTRNISYSEFIHKLHRNHKKTPHVA